MPAGDDFLRATLPALDLVHNLARRMVPSRADAEDLVQETDLRAWQAWTAGRPLRRVEPRLATICLNLGRDRARRAAPRLEVVAEALDDLADATDVEAEAAARRPALRRVEEVVTSRSDGRIDRPSGKSWLAWAAPQRGSDKRPPDPEWAIR